MFFEFLALRPALEYFCIQKDHSTFIKEFVIKYGKNIPVQDVLLYFACARSILTKNEKKYYREAIRLLDQIYNRISISNEIIQPSVFEDYLIELSIEALVFLWTTHNLSVEKLIPLSKTFFSSNDKFNDAVSKLKIDLTQNESILTDASKTSIEKNILLFLDNLSTRLMNYFQEGNYPFRSTKFNSFLLPDHTTDISRLDVTTKELQSLEPYNQPCFTFHDEKDENNLSKKRKKNYPGKPLKYIYDSYNGRKTKIVPIVIRNHYKLEPDNCSTLDKKNSDLTSNEEKISKVNKLETTSDDY